MFSKSISCYLGSYELIVRSLILEIGHHPYLLILAIITVFLWGRLTHGTEGKGVFISNSLSYFLVSLCRLAMYIKPSQCQGDTDQTRLEQLVRDLRAH